MLELAPLGELLETLGVSTLQVFADRIFEHREHQLLFALEDARPTDLIVVLNRKDHRTKEQPLPVALIEISRLRRSALRVSGCQVRNEGGGRMISWWMVDLA